MPNPLTAPLVGYASKLRFPTLLKITLVLMLLSWLLPDPIPFLDEILTPLVALVLASWRRREPPPGPDGKGGTLEGQARRE
ncbi:DUF6116 family protein [Arenimonas caeni]|jgi:hypothetical protein|uniref:Uncharacterized protein n=1 Tax=Arenimonas caeni TaxID=2058085 RepID=A0A2P6MBA2_9GAMM|nr:DUF6116 family protein [Arenimonas caeni]MDY0021348.1 DUF6116 family protein [Arenimonas caeni]PRH83283.1 hypothetical protein C6N40_03795 [Arenimonas caeni]